MSIYTCLLSVFCFSGLLTPTTPQIELAHLQPVKQIKQVRAEISAYTSREVETDSTPFLTASGSRVRPGIIACPRSMPFGTQVEIQGKTYTCQDRMNSRYEENGVHNFDIWFADLDRAIDWGRRRLTVKIYKQ